MTTEAIELKPCPFCNGVAELVEYAMPAGGPCFYYSCADEHCQGCATPLDKCARRSDAAKQWNTRPTPPLSGSDIVSKIREALERGVPHIESAIICAWPGQPLGDFNWLMSLREALALLPQLEAMLAKEPVLVMGMTIEQIAHLKSWFENRTGKDVPQFWEEAFNAGVSACRAANIPYVESEEG